LFTKSHQSRKILFRFVFLVFCSIAPNAISCPFCGFVIRTNEVASSALYAAILVLIGICLLKLRPALSRLGNIRTKSFLLGLSLIVGIFFYLWPRFRPFDVFPYDRMRQLSRFPGPLDDVCVYILIIIITLFPLWLRVVRDEGWLYRFILGLVAFAIPYFWVVTLLRYTYQSPHYLDYLVNNIDIGWIIVAILSVFPRLFPDIWKILAICIFLAFIVSGSFDTLSFSIISFILISILITIPIVFHRKANIANIRFDPKKELNGPGTTCPR
jgi:hypothetical protein